MTQPNLSFFYAHNILTANQTVIIAPWNPTAACSRDMLSQSGNKKSDFYTCRNFLQNLMKKLDNYDILFSGFCLIFHGFASQFGQICRPSGISHPQQTQVSLLIVFLLKFFQCSRQDFDKHLINHDFPLDIFISEFSKFIQLCLDKTILPTKANCILCDTNYLCSDKNCCDDS